MTRAQEKAAEARGRALEAHLATKAGPFDADSLSRSYGIPVNEIQRVLKEKGKY